jgi:hypothetical protein
MPVSRGLDAELADDPFRAVKRACLECGGPIANWRNGRRVSKAKFRSSGASPRVWPWVSFQRRGFLGSPKSQKLKGAHPRRSGGHFSGNQLPPVAFRTYTAACV